MNNVELAKLQKETDFIKYSEQLSRYKDGLILIAVRDIMGKFLGDDGLEMLQKLGLNKIDLRPNPDWRPYFAVINKGEVTYEEIGELHETLTQKVTIGSQNIDIYSAPLYSGNRASIIFNGLEYSVNGRGFNIVVISAQGEVIDSVSFDTHVENRTCFREDLNRQIIYMGKEPDILINRKSGDIRERMRMENLIGVDNYFKYKRKIKIRFFVWGAYGMWNTVDSVVMQFACDSRFDTLIVLQNKNIELVQSTGRTGVRVVYDMDYDIGSDRPDIAYFNKARDYYKNCDSLKYKINVEAALINGYCRDNSVDTLISDICSKDVDNILVEKHIYDVINANNQNCNNVWQAIGNPKFDIIYHGKNQLNELPREWGKIKDKKVVLIAFDHNWNLTDCAIDLYLKGIIQYANNNKEIGFIIRPHMMFSIEMQKNKIWDSNDIEKLKDFFDNSSNIIWDDRRDYSLAYAMADAVITDINCGITLSATVLDVPIGIMHRYDGNGCEPLYPQINECHYQIHNPEEAYAFIEMVCRGEDPKRDERNAIKEKYICNYDGNNGKRIKEFIIKQYEKKIGEKI